MEKQEKIKNRNNKKITVFSYHTVDTCPMCKSKIEPVFIDGCYSEDKKVYIFDYCCACKETFITTYSVVGNGQNNTDNIHLHENQCLGSEPNRFVKRDFDEKICSLSPQFDKIYNQALAAESYGLDEIAGVGYRKAIEFLVKDYAIHKNKSQEEEIKGMRLGQCIEDYMSDDVKALLKCSTWIGNDETHYVRKMEDKDISDMKQFIDASVYSIGVKLIREEAESIVERK